MIYGTRSNGKSHGLVLTRPVVVNKMLDRVGYVASCDLSSVKIIEPAAGDGAFAVPIISRLYESSLHFEFDFNKALSNIKLYEIDPRMSEALGVRIRNLLDKFSAIVPENLIVPKDFLLSDVPQTDIVIGNPPYVRHENIPDAQKSIYRKKFSAFTHRSDLYIAFYEKGLQNLTEGGILSFICSNRWLKNQYGKNLRNLIGHHFSLIEVIDLENVSSFEETVLAYPAITTIRKKMSEDLPFYYQVNSQVELRQFPENSVPVRKLNVKRTDWFSEPNLESSCNMRLETIVNQGFKIGIGVATGADKVFVRKDFRDLIEEELLLPILTSKDVSGNQLNWSGNYVFNPFSRKGGLIKLNNYPKAEKYLQSQKETLDRRHISKKNPLNWYRTIDRINPELKAKDKIILPDISGNKILLIDRGNFYPHHNLYYITGKSILKLELLAAVLMSDFVLNQLSEVGNSMNGGYPRWQSQNLKKLRIPVIDDMPESAADKLIQAYRSKDIRTINQLVTMELIADYKYATGQTRLFEK